MSGQTAQSGSSDATSSVSSIFRLLETASKYEWTLRLLGATLFADAIMTKFRATNFYEWDWTTTFSMANVGNLILGILAYGICVSFFSPFLYTIGRVIMTALPSWLTPAARPSLGHGRDVVRADELQDLADQEQSSYIRQILEEAKQRRKTIDDGINEFGRTSFTTFLITATNLAIAASTGHDSTLTMLLSGQEFGRRFTIELLVLLTLLAPAVTSWLYVPEPLWIRFRPLYDKNREKPDPRAQPSRAARDC